MKKLTVVFILAYLLVSAETMATTPLSEQRAALFEELKRSGIQDQRVFKALQAVDRAQFVPSRLAALAYDNTALPIEHQQTISQPYIVAKMTEALLSGRTTLGKVLEIGTGSGYQTAVLALLYKEVYTVEYIPALSKSAETRLNKLGIQNIHFKTGDGWEGWAEHAPYDGILVTAAASSMPTDLLNQLAMDASLVIPIGTQTEAQNLYCVRKTKTVFLKRSLGAVRFVPLIKGS